jgi:hypothetical protein
MLIKGLLTHYVVDGVRLNITYKLSNIVIIKRTTVKIFCVHYCVISNT